MSTIPSYPPPSSDLGDSDLVLGFSAGKTVRVALAAVAAYVQMKLQSLFDGKVAKAGDTMTGSLNVLSQVKAVSSSGAFEGRWRMQSDGNYALYVKNVTTGVETSLAGWDGDDPLGPAATPFRFNVPVYAPSYAGITYSNVTTALAFTPVRKDGDVLTGTISVVGQAKVVSVSGAYQVWWASQNDGQQVLYIKNTATGVSTALGGFDASKDPTTEPYRWNVPVYVQNSPVITSGTLTAALTAWFNSLPDEANGGTPPAHGFYLSAGALRFNP